MPTKTYKPEDVSITVNGEPMGDDESADELGTIILTFTGHVSGVVNNRALAGSLPPGEDLYEVEDFNDVDYLLDEFDGLYTPGGLLWPHIDPRPSLQIGDIPVGRVNDVLASGCVGLPVITVEVGEATEAEKEARILPITVTLEDFSIDDEEGE